jgi:hypothetical protein
MMVVSGSSAIMMMYWSTTRPTQDSLKVHRVVYETYQAMRAQHQARKWMREGTFTRREMKQPASNADGASGHRK